MPFLGKYLQRKFSEFVEREVDAGRRIPSQAEFARHLGVSNANLSQWINDNRPPVGQNVVRLADKLGPEVYDLLGLPRSMPNDPLLRQFAEHWHELSESDRQELLETVRKMAESNRPRSKRNNNLVNAG